MATYNLDFLLLEQIILSVRIVTRFFHVQDLSGFVRVVLYFLTYGEKTPEKQGGSHKTPSIGVRVMSASLAAITVAVYARVSLTARRFSSSVPEIHNSRVREHINSHPFDAALKRYVYFFFIRLRNETRRLFGTGRITPTE